MNARVSAMKTVVILTQPRSGSSLLAGILHRLGVNMGDKADLEMSKHKNKYGSYENQNFLKITHNILFDSHRLMKYKNRLHDEDGLVEKTVKEYEEELIQLIRDSESDLWGFKEAVIIYILPYFHQHLTNPYYITLHRDAASVANSQVKAGKLKNWIPEIRTEFSYFTHKRRFGLFWRTIKTTFTEGFVYRKPEFLVPLIENGQERINDFIKGKKHLYIELDKIVKETDNIITQIIDFLEIKPTKEQISDAKGFVHPELITSDVSKRKLKKIKKQKEAIK